jgi:hypothetical protein
VGRRDVEAVIEVVPAEVEPVAAPAEVATEAAGAGAVVMGIGLRTDSRTARLRAATAGVAPVVASAGVAAEAAAGPLLAVPPARH